MAEAGAPPSASAATPSAKPKHSAVNERMTILPLLIFLPSVLRGDDEKIMADTE